MTSEVFQTFSPCRSHRNYFDRTFDVYVKSHLRNAQWLCVALGVGQTGSPPPSPSPSPVASSTTAASTSEEEGLHAGALPHNLNGYICDISVYFGGGGIAPQAFLLTTAVATSEEEGIAPQGLPPNNSGGYFGGGGIAPQALFLAEGGGTGPPPHNNGEYFALSRIVYRNTVPVVWT